MSRFKFAGDFGAIHQPEYRRMAKDERISPRAFRVHFAALGWANQIGHAEFGPGELAQVLGIGCGRQADKAADKAVTAAKTMGLVLPESGLRCLVLPYTLFQKGKGTVVCNHHRASIAQGVT
ncbi:hypothetical protein [Plantactinospora sp. BB1]|uniref:hypothetical protein n=1 Tax=Plantactinospora sp. BB1 TaxID=2071627 RepID=UPI0018FEEB1A|nr:hypothetical protein [Plantactinospora sp. BB1]